MLIGIILKMKSKPWNFFCIVGLGEHAKKNLIPSLLENNQIILGIVTSKETTNFPSIKKFKSLNKAIKELPKKTMFIIASPPSAHERQITKILNSERDVFVEKPAFVKKSHIENIKLICEKKNLILLEGFMYKYTNLYKRFFDNWNSNIKNIKFLRLTFTIPANPINTFREDPPVTSTYLFDIGCYIFSLLVDLKILDRNSTKNKFFKDIYLKKENHLIYINATFNDISISIKLGIGSSYENSIEFLTNKKKSFKYWPFFSGRPIKKFILLKSNKENKKESFLDINGFRKMFKSTKKNLLENQTIDFNNMLVVTSLLEKINAKLIKS